MRPILFITGLLVSLSCFADSHLNQEQRLGERLFRDTNLSLNKNVACATCHGLKPANADFFQTQRVPGFVDPINIRTGAPVSLGSIPGTAGSLNAPSLGYTTFSPDFFRDEEGETYVGGQFWNGRASNLVEQAKMPFLNPVEMAMPNEAAVVERLTLDFVYLRQFREVFGLNLKTIDRPLRSKAAKVSEVFKAIAKAISEYEKSSLFSKFNSKFDYVMVGKTEFTEEEAKGLALFNGKANCLACHVSEITIREDGRIHPPLFTDFTYDNIGLPRNINIPGNTEPNLGLGGRQDLPADALAAENGKHKVMSLRNIAITAPYGHNGSMASLEEIVHFYNTRDTLGRVSDLNQPGFGINGWPEPEVSANVNSDELGNLGMTADEEKALVAFLKTLTDDYPQWGNDRRVPPWSRPPYQPLSDNKLWQRLSIRRIAN